MAKNREQVQPSRVTNAAAGQSELDELGPDEERVLELREEQLVANKELRDLGEVLVRTEVDSVPAQLDVDALREEVEIEHEPVGQAVSQRDEPWEGNGVLVVPVYEEQLVVTKRLILRERLRVRRISTAERRLFHDTLRRERLVVEDPQQTGLVREVYPTDEPGVSDGPSQPHASAQADGSSGSFMGNLVKRALE